MGAVWQRPIMGLLQTKDSGHRLKSISLPAVFEWSLSADSCFETTPVTAKRINLNKTEKLQVTVFADIEGDHIEKCICCKYQSVGTYLLS